MNSIFQKKKAQQNLNPSYEAKGKETSSERKCSWQAYMMKPEE